MKCLHQKMATVLFYSKRGAYCSYLSTSIAEIFMLGKVPAVMMLGESKNNLAEVKEMKQQETGNISVMGTLWHCREQHKETQKGIGLFLTMSQKACRVAAIDYVKAREAERREVQLIQQVWREGHCMAIKLDEIWKWITSGKFPALSHLWSILPTTHLITNDDKSRYEKLVH